MARLLQICHALVKNPHIGVSEKESYFEYGFLNARNEANKLEDLLNIELHREREISPAGKIYTRYTPENAEQIRKLAQFHNSKLAANAHRKDYRQHQPLLAWEIENAIALLGKGE